MTKSYTPGPWQASHEINPTLHTVFTLDGDAICHTSQLVADVPNQKQPMRKANAVLLAAAPELVEALTGMAKKAAWDHAKDYNSGDNKWAEALPSDPAYDDPDQYAEDHWEDFLTKDARAVLVKAGVFTTK
jgi:hypothetical protein